MFKEYYYVVDRKLQSQINAKITPQSSIDMERPLQKLQVKPQENTGLVVNKVLEIKDWNESLLSTM